MSSPQQKSVDYGGSIIGWCVLAAGISQLPLIFAGYLAAKVTPGGWLLLLLGVPAFLLLSLGGVGLILRRFWAYYCVYAVTFFGGIGGFKASYIPFLKRFVSLGPETEDLFLALNLALVALLMWEHWCRAGQLEVRPRQAHRIAMLSLLFLGLFAVGAGRATIHRERGEKASASELPLVGPSFASLKTSGGVPYVSVETTLPRGITLVFAGTSNESEIEALAGMHQLKRIANPDACKKFLPQVKAWKLNESVFPTLFLQEDWYFVGRLRGLPKVSLQLVYRRSTGRFTAQILGILPTRTPRAQSSLPERRT